MWGGGGGCVQVCMGVCGYGWDEFSEYLLETRVLTSSDFNTYVSSTNLLHIVFLIILCSNSDGLSPCAQCSDRSILLSYLMAVFSMKSLDFFIRYIKGT